MPSWFGVGNVALHILFAARLHVAPGPCERSTDWPGCLPPWRRLSEVGAGCSNIRSAGRNSVKANGPAPSHVFALDDKPPPLQVWLVGRSGGVDESSRLPSPKWNGSGKPSAVARSPAAPADVPGGHEGELRDWLGVPAATAPPAPLAISEKDHRATSSYRRCILYY
jgi:hypothetical protein